MPGENREDERRVWCGKIAGCLVLVYASWRGGWIQESVCNEHLWRPEYATPRPAGSLKAD